MSNGVNSSGDVRSFHCRISTDLGNRGFLGTYGKTDNLQKQRGRLLSDNLTLINSDRLTVGSMHLASFSLFPRVCDGVKTLSGRRCCRMRRLMSCGWRVGWSNWQRNVVRQFAGASSDANLDNDLCKRPRSLLSRPTCKDVRQQTWGLLRPS